MYISTLDSPIGHMMIQANELGVYAIKFPAEIPDEVPNHISEQAKEQFRQYFEGKSSAFNFPMMQQGTDFQQKVWDELRKIEAGNPITYTALAKRLNNPLAIRAIASANGRNNLMIAVPCHRVIGINGDLVGFSAGLWRKKWLLEHEVKMTQSGQSSLIL